MAEASNDIPIEAWDTVLFEKFARFRYMLPLGLGRHGAAALERRPYPAGARVLDIGCGFGDSTLQIAAQIGSARTLRRRLLALRHHVLQPAGRCTPQHAQGA